MLLEDPGASLLGWTGQIPTLQKPPSNECLTPPCLEMHPRIVPGYPCCLPHHQLCWGFAPLPFMVSTAAAAPNTRNAPLGTRFSVVFGLSQHRQGSCTPTLPCALLRAPIPLFLGQRGLLSPSMGWIRWQMLGYCPDATEQSLTRTK